MEKKSMLSMLASAAGMGGQGMAAKAISTTGFEQRYKKYYADEIANDRDPLPKDEFIKKYGDI